MAWDNRSLMDDIRRFCRANPQVLVLLLICLILGIGTFLAVIFGLASAGGGHVTGEPEGVISFARTLLG